MNYLYYFDNFQNNKDNFSDTSLFFQPLYCLTIRELKNVSGMLFIVTHIY